MKITFQFAFAISAAAAATALADPCGMVPPIYVGEGVPITRVGDQQTYVFFKDGVEAFVIRPGFEGKVDEFGMLIPFPTPPAMRKVPDNVFSQIAAAADPPEVVIDLRQLFLPRPSTAPSNQNGGAPGLDAPLAFQQVRVIKQEAIGMYEVTVLEAGSSAALKRWMDDHGYKYPDGMDKVCDDYVELDWCFVAVKTKVGQKNGVEPAPGKRNVDSKLPGGSVFDGHVQGMAFRFQTEELVVPMRLSAFNAGDLHNVVYLLTDGPKKIRSIPEEYVVRQVAGDRLFKNLTAPLPLRVIGGSEDDIPAYRLRNLPAERDPAPHNGVAKELFAADVLAVTSGELALPHEENEKALLNIGERLGMRGKEIDDLNAAAVKEGRDEAVARALGDVKELTLTVVDGDFPREVLSKQNLTFAAYKMPAGRNAAKFYDTKLKKAATKRDGVVIYGDLKPPKKPNDDDADVPPPPAPPGSARLWQPQWWAGLALASLMLVGLMFGGTMRYRRK